MRIQMKPIYLLCVCKKSKINNSDIILWFIYTVFDYFKPILDFRIVISWNNIYVYFT